MYSIGLLKGLFLYIGGLIPGGRGWAMPLSPPILCGIIVNYGLIVKERLQ